MVQFVKNDPSSVFHLAKEVWSRGVNRDYSFGAYGSDEPLEICDRSMPRSMNDLERVRTELEGMVGRLESTNLELQTVLADTATQLSSIESTLAG